MRTSRRALVFALLAAGIPSALSAAPAKRTRPAALPPIIGTIEIPRLEVSSEVREGQTEATLSRGVGHIPGTALPGQKGNVGMAGHRTSFFKPLGSIRPGDMIRVKTAAGSFSYLVLDTEIVLPEDVRVLDPDSYPRLTLVTCFPFEYKGHAPKRFIVHAQLIESAGASQAGR